VTAPGVDGGCDTGREAREEGAERRIERVLAAELVVTMLRCWAGSAAQLASWLNAPSGTAPAATTTVCGAPGGGGGGGGGALTTTSPWINGP
jgi:hypothetical protein